MPVFCANETPPSANCGSKGSPVATGGAAASVFCGGTAPFAGPPATYTSCATTLPSQSPPFEWLLRTEGAESRPASGPTINRGTSQALEEKLSSLEKGDAGRYTGWGKSGFTVVSTHHSAFSCYYVLIVVLFPMWKITLVSETACPQRPVPASEAPATPSVSLQQHWDCW